MRDLLNFFLKNNSWFLFIFLETVSLLLLFRFNNYQGGAFFTASNRVIGLTCELVTDVTGYFRLKSINEELVRRNVELELQIEHLRSTLLADTMQFAALKEEALSGYDCRMAKVIGSSLTHKDNYITINKGENDGVRPEMGVISGTGIVGIVYIASSGYSVVIPVLNSKSNVSCKIKGTGYFGLLKWDGGSAQYAYVKDMPRHSLFSLGDTVVTSGYSSVFPGGIPVGTVEDISDSNDGLSYLLKVKLFTDFGNLSDVCVVVSRGQAERMELEQKLKGEEK